jgi:general L-amino acid transport system substrate-binding protein
MRTRFKDPAQAVVLPEIISKEPLGPAVRAGDDAWFNIVRWTLFVMIDAEEMEISSRNVDRVRENSTLPRVRRLLGLEGDYGRQMGLGEDWAYQIIRQVGNYAESFERNVGSASALNIGRGQNALWKDGGLLYAPPVQ